jgi:methylmalonyl-CoA mutase
MEKVFGRHKAEIKSVQGVFLKASGDDEKVKRRWKPLTLC